MMIKSMEKWNSSNIWNTTLINQNSIQEEIKNRLKVGMLAIIQCRIFCLLFYMGVKLGCSY
jgi:hypothetical protein